MFLFFQRIHWNRRALVHTHKGGGRPSSSVIVIGQNPNVSTRSKGGAFGAIVGFPALDVVGMKTAFAEHLPQQNNLSQVDWIHEIEAHGAS